MVYTSGGRAAIWIELFGKAEPFRTSSGKAALKRVLTQTLDTTSKRRGYVPFGTFQTASSFSERGFNLIQLKPCLSSNLALQLKLEAI